MKHTLSIVLITFFPFIVGKVIPSGNSDQKVENDVLTTTYPEHIAGAYTGGFGEQSCHSCHFDYDLNQSEGKLSVSGIEDGFEAGQEYTINIRVNRPDMNVAGFQMTARFENGSQAGDFKIGDEFTTTPNIESKVVYLQHAVEKVDVEDDEKSWQISWTSPEQATRPVVFNIAVNAANGDASAFGDWIYLKEIKVAPKNE